MSIIDGNMNANEVFNDIILFCEKNANEDIVKKYSRYFKGCFVGYGLETGMIQTKAKEYKKEAWFTINLVYDVSKLLVKEEKYELPSFALLLLNEFSKEVDLRTFKEVESWFSLGINNWAHTDGICQYFFPVFWKKGIIKPDDLSGWRNSNNKFQRRCVPVALIKYLKINQDFSKLFDFIEPMMMDTEREVHQGLGWFLRESWKKNNNATEEFLMKWKNNCARLIIQYATEKISKEDRLRFRKDK